MHITLHDHPRDGAPTITVAQLLERRCDDVLMNTAIAGAKDPQLMARAMKLAGRAEHIPRKRYASASSPIDGMMG